MFSIYESFPILKYCWYGSVRFDTKNVDIQFHTNIDEVNSTIANNLPNPKEGFQNSSIGSNVFDVIEKFFSNTQAPVFGSRIFILLKRYPNEADTSRLVALIRSHHESFEDYQITASFPLYLYPYPVYATTIQVTGNGTKTISNFYPFQSDVYWIAITYQDHVPVDSFQNLNLRWDNRYDSGNFAVDLRNVSDIWCGGTYIYTQRYFNKVDYKITLDYNYSDQDVQNLQIRIYSTDPPSNWLPYSD